MENIALTVINLPCRLASSQAILRKAVFIIVFFVILPFLAFYLFQMGDLIKNNYLIKNSQNQIRQINEEALSLKAESAALGSLEQTEAELAVLGFVKAQDITYIPIFSSLLAKNKIK